MKRVKLSQKNQAKKAENHRHMVTQRLDESIPLDSKEWQAVEQVLMRMTEFAPASLITECVNAIAVYADELSENLFSHFQFLVGRQKSWQIVFGDGDRITAHFRRDNLADHILAWLIPGYFPGV